MHRAYDRELRTEVAYKTLRRLDEDDAGWLKEEFRVRQGIQHANLVQFYELVLEDGACFFTMELVDGVDAVSFVRRQLPDGAPLDAAGCSRLSQVLRQLLSALQHLHGANCVHRDLKPANVLVEPAGRVVVLDFGLARRLDRPSGAAEFAGTLGYIPPEVAAWGPFTPQGDVFSVGVMLSEMLTGAACQKGPAQLRRQLVRLQTERTDLSAIVRSCVEMLSADPERRPSTQRLLEQLSQDSGAQPTGSFTEKRKFVGRWSELSVLAQSWEESTSKSHPITTLVLGAPGIGKSALVEQFINARPEVTVLQSRCRLDEHIPFQALDSVVEQLGVELASLGLMSAAVEVHGFPALLRVFPSLRALKATSDREEAPGRQNGLPPSELRAQAQRGFIELLRLVSQSSPLVIVIDDVQWIDADSRPWLVQVRRAESLRLLLVLAGRLEALNVAGVEDLVTDARQIELEGLSAAECTSLAAAYGRNTPGTLDNVGGNPLLVHEVLRADTLGTDGVDLAALMERRLATLPPGTRELLAVLAVSPRPVSRTRLAIMEEVDGTTIAAAESLAGGGLLRTSLDRGTLALEPFHDELRSCVMRTLSNADRIRLHRCHASALAVADEPHLLAWHLVEAGAKAEALAPLMEAGQRSYGALAFEDATRQFELAQACGGEPSQLQPWIAKSLAAAGKPRVAADTWLAWSTTAPAGESEHARREAAELLIGAGHLDRGKQLLLAELNSAGIRLPRTTLGAVADIVVQRRRLAAFGFAERRKLHSHSRRDLELLWTASAVMGFFDAAKAEGLRLRYLLAALQSGDSTERFRALVLEACALGATGRNDADEQNLRAQITTALPHVGHPQALAYRHLLDGYRAFIRGELAEAERGFADAEALYAEHGVSRWDWTLCKSHQLFTKIYQSQYRELTSDYEHQIRQAMAAEDRTAATSLELGAGYLLDLLNDKPNAAKERIERAIAGFQTTLPPTLWYLTLLSRLVTHLYAGDYDAALHALHGTGSKLRMMRVFQNIRVLTSWYRGMAIIGDGSLGVLSRHRVQRLGESLLAESSRFSRGPGFALLAAAAASNRHLDQCLSLLSNSENAFLEAGMHGHAAAARFRKLQVQSASISEPADVLTQLGVQNAGRWVDSCVPRIRSQ